MPFYLLATTVIIGRSPGHLRHSDYDRLNLSWNPICFLSLQVQRRNSTETRIFDRPTTVLSTNGKNTERFNSGERAKNIKRIVKRVMFEPASLHRVAGTYATEPPTEREWN